MRSYPRSARLLGSVALIVVTSLAMAGCKTNRAQTSAGLLDNVYAAQTEADARGDLDSWGARYRANPKDAAAAIAYAQGLRAIGQRSQAVAVLEQASLHNPRNTALLGAYGRALADAGSYEQALDLLGRAHTPDQPDPRILSAHGAVLDQMGRHDEARRYYETALRIVPEDASVLSNLGLSYALSKELPRAEATLRRAVARPGADPRVRQNLALVVGLQGRFAEAEAIARADLPADEAAANVAYLRLMISQQTERSQLRPDPGPGQPPRTRG
jgi:Flp pilus assembly protein TadD